MSIQKAFNVKISRKTGQAAVTLGIGGPHIQRQTVARSYSIDINMSPHCPFFQENIPHQRSMITEFLKKHIDLISNVCIYAENKSFRRNEKNLYDPYGHAKLHWHGIFTVYPEFDKKDVIDRFIKYMRKTFSEQSSTSTHRSVFYKKIRNSQHLSDRTSYQSKQQPLLCKPINYNNTIKNI